MPSYTLYYFDHRGRAEICRMIFAVAGVQYNDKRIDCKQWNSCRNKMPCSMLPVLEIDGKTLIPQSMAIARFLAREYGFYGKNNLAMVQNDSVCDSLYELLDDYLRMYHDKDGRIMFDSRSDMRKKYIDMDGKMGFDMRSDMDCNSSPRSTKTTMGSPPNMSPGSTSPTISELDNRMTESRRRYLITCRRVLPFLEKSLEKQNGGIQFFLGDQLMMCDLMCFSALECPLMENPNLLNNFPKITALRNRVYNHAKLSGYLKTRSNCDW